MAEILIVDDEKKINDLIAMNLQDGRAPYGFLHSLEKRH